MHFTQITPKRSRYDEEKHINFSNYLFNEAIQKNPSLSGTNGAMKRNHRIGERGKLTSKHLGM